MAQNEMRAKPALPVRVRSMEGLGTSASLRCSSVLDGQDALAKALPRTCPFVMALKPETHAGIRPLSNLFAFSPRATLSVAS